MANTAKSSNLGYVAWEAEDSFADAADDTYTTGIQIRDDMIDFSGLERQLIDPGGVRQRMNESDLYRLGAFGLGTFTITVDLSGMGSTAAGDLTEPNISKLFAHVFGATDWTAYGGVSSGAGDENGAAPTLVTDGGSEAWVNGGMVRIGAVNDGRCGGQAYALGAPTGTPVTSTELLMAAPGASTDGDVVYAMGLVYPSTVSNTVLTSDGSTNNNTLRFVLMSGNLAYVCRGCACTGVSLSGINPGEIPQMTLTFSTVAWNPISVTYPSATALADKAPAPVANGSVFIQTAGTVTRATVVPMETTIELGQGMVPRFGPGGENVAQNVVGWHRVPAPTMITMTVEAEAQTASPSYWLTANPTIARHCMVTLSCVDGSSLAIYFPRLLETASPTMGDWNGLRSRTLSFKAATGTTTTNDLTLSAWRLGMA